MTVPMPFCYSHPYAILLFPSRPPHSSRSFGEGDAGLRLTERENCNLNLHYIPNTDGETLQ